MIIYSLVLADVVVTLLDLEHAHPGGGGTGVAGRLDVGIVLVNHGAAGIGNDYKLYNYLFNQ